MNLSVECELPLRSLLTARLYFVCIFGTLLAAVSLCLNSIVFYLLVRSRARRNSHFLHLIFLAAFDILLALCYVPVMSFKLLVDYTESLALLHIWISYTIPVLTVSQVGKTATTYLIITATLERYWALTTSRSDELTQRCRHLTISAGILCAVVIKLGIYWELEVGRQEHCAGRVTELIVQRSALMDNKLYAVVWAFWVRGFVTTIIPFATLAVLNVRIVVILRQHTIGHLLRQFLGRQEAIRAATRMLCLVVCTYLASNLLNVLLTVWEYIDPDSLYDRYIIVYALVNDLVTILTIAASALRLPIYCWCSADMRNQLYAAFGRPRRSSAAPAAPPPSFNERHSLLPSAASPAPRATIADSYGLTPTAADADACVLFYNPIANNFYMWQTTV